MTVFTETTRKYYRKPSFELATFKCSPSFFVIKERKSDDEKLKILRNQFKFALLGFDVENSVKRSY